MIVETDCAKVNRWIERCMVAIGSLVMAVGIWASFAATAPAAAAPVEAVAAAPALAVDAAPALGGQCCYNPWQVFRGLACYSKADGSLGQVIRWGPDRADKYQDIQDGSMILSPELVACPLLLN